MTTVTIDDRATTDVNAVVGNLLRDLSVIQTVEGKKFAYKRAAAAILALEHPLSVSRGRLEKIPGVGPSSERVIREVLDTGTSPTVERAIDVSHKRAEINQARALRTNFLSRAEVIRILADRSVAGPTVSDVRGDLQMHSEWSDGTPTVRELRDACTARQYTFAAVTDHSYGLKTARGMSMEAAKAQRAEIGKVNSAVRHACEMFRGVEANIDAEGALDLSDEQAEQFDIVLAAPHSVLRKTTDQTQRMLRAISHPAVRVLAHPRGRLAGARAGVVADWDAVFALAATSGVAIEIDGDPSRQDIDFGLAARALDAGVLFALDSDAHTTDQLVYAETAIAHARLAGIPVDRIVNCWPLGRFRAWLAEPRREMRSLVK
jgi:histidinol phosphatase-like PHP family hydrolase